MEQSYTIIYKGDIESSLRENGINRYMILNGQLAVIYVDNNFSEDTLNSIENITWWEEAYPMSSLINITDTLSSGETVINASGVDYIYNNPYISVKGEGVVIAIIDSGIDYLHPDFINEDGTSKIISIWDQESTNNTPPEGKIFGSEITREEINQAIINKDSSLSIDNRGTGTIAAGIAAGNGRLNNSYTGVAVGSELVVVKLREYKDTYEEGNNRGTGTIAAGIAAGNGRLNNSYTGVAVGSELVVVKLREYKDTYEEGKINYLNTDFLAAISYIGDVIRKERKLLIINLTVGDRSQSVILTNLLDTFSYLNSTGIVLVSGAGNEGNTDIHYEGQFIDNQTSQDVIIEVANQKMLDIALTANGPGTVGVTVISPSGEMSYQVMYSPDNQVYRGRFNLENSSYEIRLIYPWILSGNELLKIRIDDIRPGIWTLRLFPEILTTGEYDIYLPNQNLIPINTRFLDPNSCSTITLYATIENVITIGAYNDKTSSMWIGSSKGPIKGKGIKPDIVAPGVDIISPFINQSYTTSTGTGVKTSSMWIGSSKGPIKGKGIKPDIVAPGVDIISPFINQSYTTSTGTGVSSSLTCGVLALIMEYISQQGNYARKQLFTQVLKTYLMRGATKQDIYTYPNPSQGYGILNLKNTIEAIANNI